MKLGKEGEAYFENKVIINFAAELRPQVDTDEEDIADSMEL